jgi:hypothetical protein
VSMEHVTAAEFFIVVGLFFVLGGLMGIQFTWEHMYKKLTAERMRSSKWFVESRKEAMRDTLR